MEEEDHRIPRHSRSQEKGREESSMSCGSVNGSVPSCSRILTVRAEVRRIFGDVGSEESVTV